MKKTLIIIPTYNEMGNIDRILEAVFHELPGVQVLVVDDNSPDKTYDRVLELERTHYTGNLFLLHRTAKEGLGRAYIAGFKWALEKGYEYIFEMDADFSHHPIYLPRFIEALENGADLAIGSRYIQGGGVKGWGLNRKIISKGGSTYAKVILGLPLNDLTGGYKCFKREVLESIGLDKVRSNGYSFQIELTYRTVLANYKVVEVPIIFEDREVGVSKMSKNIFVEALKMVWWMRKNRKKIQRGEI